jgi:putative serine protease PepD
MLIEITSGPDAGRREDVRGDRFTLGREGSCNLVLRDPKASRRHAYLVALPDGSLQLVDMGSSNGTFVGGQQVTQATLRGGEEIRIGDTTMRAVAEAPAAAPAGGAAVPPQPAAPVAPGGGAPVPPPPEPPPPPPPAVPPPPVPQGPPAPPMQAPGFPPPTEPFAPAGQPLAPPPPPSPSTIQRLVIQRGIRRVTILGIVVLVLLVGVIVALVAGVFSGDEDKGLTPAQVVDDVRPSTVLVVNDKGGGTVGRGSGWVWDASRGLIVTNAHVTAGGAKYTISRGDKIMLDVTETGDVRAGAEARDAELKGQALCEDMAVLQVEDRTGLETMPRVPRQKDLHVADEVVAVGYPATANLSANEGFSEADLTGNTGVVSTVETTFQAIPGEGPDDPEVGPYRNVILTDTVINQGNSGGPLVNLEGKLVGMNSAQRTDVQGQNYAIGVDRINEIVPKLIDGEDPC